MWTASAGTWTRFSKRNKYNKRIAFPEMKGLLQNRPKWVKMLKKDVIANQ